MGVYQSVVMTNSPLRTLLSPFGHVLSGVLVSSTDRAGWSSLGLVPSHHRTTL